MPAKKIITLGSDFVYSEIKDLHNVAVMEQLEKRLQKIQDLKGVSSQVLNNISQLLKRELEN